MAIIFLFSLLGIFAGFFAGLLGIGGGVIIVPGCVAIFQLMHLPANLWMHMAIASSLASVTVTATASVRAHQKHGTVLWTIARRLTPGIIIGISLGTYLGHLMTTTLLSNIFAIFIIIIAIRMGLNIQPHPEHTLPGWFGLSLFAIVMGISTGLLGIGGGILAVPFLARCNIPMTSATGTSAACTLVIGCLGTLNFIWHGWNTVTLPWSTGYIYWPAVLGISLTSVLLAPIGAKWTQRLPIPILKRTFALFLLLIGMQMLNTAA